jgi:DNA-binding FadR family transcriptional regulator
LHSSWQLHYLLPRIERRSLSGYVADRLRELIMRGDLPAGQQLPSLRTLASHLGISIPTLREALTALAYSGLIELHQGRGCFVSRRPGAARTVAVNFHRSSTTDLATLRTMIEPVASRLAADRRDQRLGTELAMLAGERARLARSGYAQEFAATDAAFHRMMVSGSGVPLAIDLHRRTMDRLHDPGLRRAADLADDATLDDMHYRLADAVGRGDAATAVRLTNELVKIEVGANRIDMAHPARAGPIPPLP